MKTRVCNWWTRWSTQTLGHLRYNIYVKTFLRVKSSWFLKFVFFTRSVFCPLPYTVFAAQFSSGTLKLLSDSENLLRDWLWRVDHLSSACSLFSACSAVRMTTSHQQLSKSVFVEMQSTTWHYWVLAWVFRILALVPWGFKLKTSLGNFNLHFRVEDKVSGLWCQGLGFRARGDFFWIHALRSRMVLV